jgi:hypothetical protein
MGWIVASQSMAALGPMRFLCDTRPRRVVRVLPSNATFANAVCTVTSSIRAWSTGVVRSYGVGWAAAAVTAACPVLRERPRGSRRKRHVVESKVVGHDEND